MRTLQFLILLCIARGAIAQDINILAWNIDSGKSDPEVIEQQLEAMRGSFDILALNEVLEKDFDRFGNFFQENSYVASETGHNNRLLIAWDNTKLSFVEQTEIKEWKNLRLKDGGRRAPFIATFKIKGPQKTFHLLNNHLSREKVAERNQQAKVLVDLVARLSDPVIAVGEYNLDYDLATGAANEAYSILLADGLFRWIKPLELIDTQWVDHNRDDVDDTPGLIQHFAFIAHSKWDCESKIIVRPGDFPDDNKTSAYRPVWTSVSPTDK